MAKVVAIVPAAGSGIRLGTKLPKQFLRFDKIPILALTLLNLNRIDEIDSIVLVYPAKWLKEIKTILQTFEIPKISRLIPGGETRQESVYNGFKAIDPGCDIVLVHDAVRPFVSASLIKESIEQCQNYDGAILAVPVKDTVKRSFNHQTIKETVSREGLWLAQTPQTFRREILKQAFRYALETNLKVTDEASLVEAIGGKVYLIKSNYMNIKITMPEDLLLARAILPHFLKEEKLEIPEINGETLEK